MSILASMKISSDACLLPVVRAFGRELADALGLGADDGAKLAGALHDAVRAVCERAYPGDPAGAIELALEPAERGLRVAVHDWGRPLMSADDPAELPPELARLGAAVEDLRLINLGSDGKRLSFVWRAAHALEVAPAAADAPPPAAPAGDGSRIAVRDGVPDDAEPIAQLLYENYALSYVHPDFYRPRWLREELRAGRVLSSVAVDAGHVVGHHALLRARDAPAAETGVAVVAAAYRGLGIFGRLSEHTLARARSIGLPAVYAQAVTMHPYSQRVELAHGYRESAVCLGASPARVTMHGLPAATAGRRTALMVSFLPLRRSERAASLPARYREPLSATYELLGLPPPAPAERPAGARTPLAVARDESAGIAVLTLGGWDRAIATAATERLRTLLDEHVDVIYVDLDLAAIAEPDAAVDALRQHGFSYAGLRLHGPGDHDHLRLQRLNCSAVELEAIAAASAAGRELIRYVLDDYANLSAVV